MKLQSPPDLGIRHGLRSNFLLNYGFQSYIVSPDGKRFLMIRRDEGSVLRQLNVILNWSDEGARPPAGNK